MPPSKNKKASTNKMSSGDDINSFIVFNESINELSVDVAQLQSKTDALSHKMTETDQKIDHLRHDTQQLALNIQQISTSSDNVTNFLKNMHDDQLQTKHQVATQTDTLTAKINEMVSSTGVLATKLENVANMVQQNDSKLSTYKNGTNERFSALSRSVDERLAKIVADQSHTDDVIKKEIKESIDPIRELVNKHETFVIGGKVIRWICGTIVAGLLLIKSLSPEFFKSF